MEPANFLAETSAARDTPAWSAAQVQLLAYASREVLDALNEARSVDFEESSRFDKVQEAMKAAAASGADDQAFPERVIPVIKQAISALDKGHKCDMALIDLMRTELRSPR